MFRHRITEQVSKKTYFDWFLLSFLSGSVNAGGWLGAHRFVSHVTGFATLAGYDAALGRWSDAIGILSVPIYFLGGVMMSAYWIDRRISEGKAPRFELVMGLISALLLLAAGGGYFGLFGVFGQDAELRVDYIFLVLLCAASGLQNAAVTSASGASLRTTHLTGITTDLGIGLIRLVSMPTKSALKSLEAKVSLLRLGTIGSFMMGSAVGAVLFLKFEYLGFLLPAFIAIYAMCVAIGDRKAYQGPASASVSALDSESSASKASRSSKAIGQ